MTTHILRSGFCRHHVGWTSVIFLLAVGSADAQGGAKDVKRTPAAVEIVVGTVARVEPMEHENEYGDKLIISRTTIVVEEVLKGSPAATITLDVEGGTLGDLTLNVSDMPSVRRGDRGVFFVTRSRQGQNVLHQRGRGLLRLNKDDIVDGTGLTLDSIRRELSAFDTGAR